MLLTRDMVRSGEVIPAEGVILLVAEDENGKDIGTGKFMRKLAGRTMLNMMNSSLGKRHPNDGRGSLYQVGEISAFTKDK